MKAFRRFTQWILVGMMVGLVVGCATSKSGSTTEDSRAEDSNTITREEIEQTGGHVNLQDLIKNRVAGIQVVQTADGRVRARLRGQSSISGNDAVLFVVDGVPVEPNPDGSLPGIVLSEIESIEVLKDPVDTARYGMLGANGVILVTTKKGRGN